MLADKGCNVLVQTPITCRTQRLTSSSGALRKEHSLSSIVEQGGEGTQVTIIVVLFRQLPYHQGAQGKHLLSQELRSRGTGEGESERMNIHKETRLEKHTNRDRKRRIKRDKDEV